MENCVADSRGNRLSYAFDAGRLTPPSLNSLDQDSATRIISDSPESNDSDTESNRRAGLCASIQLLSESVLRMEAAEMEMAKAREAWRVESERRSAELENELTQMLLNTQLQMASFLSQTKKKRKRVQLGQDEGDHSDFAETERQGLLMLGLLQSNLSFL